MAWAAGPGSGLFERDDAADDRMLVAPWTQLHCVCSKQGAWGCSWVSESPKHPGHSQAATSPCPPLLLALGPPRTLHFILRSLSTGFLLTCLGPQGLPLWGNRPFVLPTDNVSAWGH